MTHAAGAFIALYIVFSLTPSLARTILLKVPKLGGGQNFKQ